MSESTVTVFVCVSCRRRRGDGETFDQPGHALALELGLRLREMSRPDVAIVEVDCLAVCTRPCTLALAGTNKWTYLIGDLEPESHTEEIVAAVKSFAASDSGIIAWRLRPPSFRKGVVARVPPRPARPGVEP